MRQAPAPSTGPSHRYSRRTGRIPVRPGEGGFTLVELTIALVLTSVMFSTMLVVFQTQNRINTVEQDVLESQQNARMAMTALRQDIRQAGYYVDHFNRQPIWLDAAPYQLVFNANLSDRFVSMHRDSAVPLSDGTMYHPGDFTSPPQEENLPAYLDRYLNESETIRLSLDRTYDGRITTSDRQEGAANPNIFTLSKEINGNPPAVLAYNVRGPRAYPDGSMPKPLFQYWGTFTSDDVLELWGDSNGDGRLSASEVASLTSVPINQLDEIQQVSVTIIVETSRPDLDFVGVGSTAGNPNQYRQYELRGLIRARNVGINPAGLQLCGTNPDPPVNPTGYDTPEDRGGSLTLEWDSSPDEWSDEQDVQYYTIYRRLGMGEFQVVGSVQAMMVDTTYVFEDDGDIDNFDAPVDGSEYYYFIAAWDCAPQESIPSAYIGPLVPQANGPAPPVIIDAWDTACDSGADITITFQASPDDDGTAGGVSHYQLYRGTILDSSIVSKVIIDTLITASGATGYTYHDNIGNPAGAPPVDFTSYYYIMRSIRNEVESENSNEFGAVWSSSGLSAARLLTVADKPGDDGRALLLNWRRSASEDCSPTIDAYYVMRRIQGTSTWFKVDEIAASGLDYYDYEDDNSGAGLVNGTTYEYSIYTVRGGDAEDSNIMEGTPVDNPPIGTPTGLVAADVACEADGDIEVSWNRSPDDGSGSYTVDEYHLYRKLQGGSWAHIFTIPAVGSATYSWIDSEENNPGNAPVLGSTYVYRVAAYDDATTSESDPSNEDDARSDGSPGAPAITAAYDVYAGGGREIRVEWAASADDGGCADTVTEYYVYRTTTEGQYTSEYIGTISATDAGAYTWLDNAANSLHPPVQGYSYWYILRAYDAVNDLLSLTSNEFGPVEPYGASCDCCPVFRDDFESGNTGWSAGGTRNDWDMGDPAGDSFDPSLAHSGSNVIGNDLGQGYRDGMYRSRADCYIISPTIDLSAYTEGRVTLSFWRWLSVEDASWDQADILINTGSGWTRIWRNTTDGNTVDTRWKLQYLDLTPYNSLGSSSVRLAWTLDTDNNTQFGGWNVDDVEVCYTAINDCDEIVYETDSAYSTQANNCFIDLTALEDVYLNGLIVEWGNSSNRLKRIRRITGSAEYIWTASVAEQSGVELYFDSPVEFEEDETIRFRFEFEPGQIPGEAFSIKLLTSCGQSNAIFFMVPE